MDAHRERDPGFTLVELLVVMVIIGILASIAVPTFLRQRGSAHDTATKADVSALGTEVATYFVDGGGPLVLVYTGGNHIDITDGAYTTFARLTVGSVPPAVGASANLGDPNNWCVALTDPRGQAMTYKYRAQGGLSSGACP